MGNTKHTKEQIRERIQQKKLLFDGAFGTYYGGKYDTKQLPELANLEAPERVKEIHTEYLEAGAQILRDQHLCSQQLLHGYVQRTDRGDSAKPRTPGERRRWLRGENAPVRRKKSISPEISDRSLVMRWHRRILYAVNTKRSVVFFWKRVWTFLSLKHFPRWKRSCLRSK